MNTSKSIPPVGLLLAVHSPIHTRLSSLQAEDVYVTSGLGTGIRGCPPSCAYNLGTTVHSYSVSTACPVARNQSLFGVTSTAGWAVTPTLTNHPGVYRILVTKGTATDCPSDLVVQITATGGSLADADGIAQTALLSTAFQGANSVNTWTLVGYITNSIAQPTITFAYASGGASRFYMDAVDFQSVDGVSVATPARISQILHSNPVILSGTGPVSHAFALLSSTDPAQTAKPVDKRTNQCRRDRSLHVHLYSRHTRNTVLPRVITQ